MFYVKIVLVCEGRDDSVSQQMLTIGPVVNCPHLPSCELSRIKQVDLGEGKKKGPLVLP